MQGITGVHVLTGLKALVVGHRKSSGLVPTSPLRIGADMLLPKRTIRMIMSLIRVSRGSTPYYALKPAVYLEIQVLFASSLS